MGLPVHTVEVLNGSTPLARPDRLALALIEGLANVAGGSAGAAVTVAVTGLDLPAKYTVVVSPNQDATWYVSAKTNTGFTVNLNPRLAANTLAAGTIDIAILA
ncbi:hypothetical protein [Paraburkholderia sp. BL17N1]|uniref:hypothetical protein n=1 Tax=Paraburkholderia sp. BL17N1 TaxID=1938798 RepID=UPI000EB4AE79|nr:hypothetical protein [Paraburkholderia sp. BL17N1]RKR46303.1 hypothetical protein B0G82_3986 [Paraburkholderia sp. BL17N1]